MFWGAFGFGIRSALWPMLGDPESARGGVSSRTVLACLQENLPTILEPGSIFIQDNALTYTAKIVQDWIKEWAEENGVTLLDWSAYSPDLNPIENLWKLLKEEICNRFPELSDMPKNQASYDALVRAAITVWDDFEESLLNRLLDSMVRRLEAVIKTDGWYTKY